MSGIQRQERINNVETLAHQKWSGAEYYDNLSKIIIMIVPLFNSCFFILVKTVQGGVSSTAAMGKGVTEAQFGKH